MFDLYPTAAPAANGKKKKYVDKEFVCTTMIPVYTQALPHFQIMKLHIMEHIHHATHNNQ